MGFTNVEVSIDSKVVVQAIHSGRVQGAIGYSLIKRIRSMLDKDWNVEIMHEYREANKCADALARIGCSLEHNMIIYQGCQNRTGHRTGELIGSRFNGRTEFRSDSVNLVYSK
jgi:ribonuclease HI